MISKKKTYNSYLIDHLRDSKEFVYSGDRTELVSQVTVVLPEKIVSSLPEKYRLLHNSFLTSKDHDRLYLLNYILAEHYGIDITSSKFLERMHNLVRNYLFLTIMDKVKDGEISPEDGKTIIPKEIEDPSIRTHLAETFFDDDINTRNLYLDMLYKRYRAYGEYVSQTMKLCYMLRRKERTFHSSDSQSDHEKCGHESSEHENRYQENSHSDNRHSDNRHFDNSYHDNCGYEKPVKIDLAGISTASTIWLILQQLSDDLTDWEEDESSGSGVWCGIEKKERTKRSLLMRLPELIGEIRTIAGMTAHLRFNDLAVQDLYFWLIEKESVFAHKLNLGTLIAE